MQTKSFLGALDHERIVKAIQDAEARSRGEVRVHVSQQGRWRDAEAAARAQFETLGMTQTAERNGVLLFVAPVSQTFAVIGDQGIHARCGADFWKDVAAAMEADFRAGRFTDGIVKGVARVGDALATHFPRTDGAADAERAARTRSRRTDGILRDQAPLHGHGSQGQRRAAAAQRPVPAQSVRRERGQRARAGLEAIPGLLPRPELGLLAQRLAPRPQHHRSRLRDQPEVDARRRRHAEDQPFRPSQVGQARRRRRPRADPRASRPRTAAHRRPTGRRWRLSSSIRS